MNAQSVFIVIIISICTSAAVVWLFDNANLQFMRNNDIPVSGEVMMPADVLSEEGAASEQDKIQRYDTLVALIPQLQEALTDSERTAQERVEIQSQIDLFTAELAELSLELGF